MHLLLIPVFDQVDGFPQVFEETGGFLHEEVNGLVQDQIHLTDKGGELLAKYYWGKLKNLYPYE